jgi:uncharacterized protein with PIN domain/sulfur carrier protein ThiS
MAGNTAQVTIRFYEELNDFLDPSRRKKPFNAPFHPGDTVKALIEALGVPHTEVDLILVNGESVPFNHRLHDGERVSVYPVFESIEIGGITRVRPSGLRRTRFVLDVHLGRLAKLLRMLGFDARYANDLADDALSRISHAEGRIVLTRDRELLKRSLISHGYWIRSHRPPEQLVEVIKRFDLAGKIRPFSRCLRCNEELQRTRRSRVAASVPRYVARTYRAFSTCPCCGRIYWPGSHWENMKKILTGETARNQQPPNP